MPLLSRNMKAYSITVFMLHFLTSVSVISAIISSSLKTLMSKSSDPTNSWEKKENESKHQQEDACFDLFKLLFFFWLPLIINFSHIDEKKKSRHIPLFKGHKLGIFAKLTKTATSLKLELSRLIQNSFGLPPWKHFVLICTWGYGSYKNVTEAFYPPLWSHTSEVN